MMKLGKAKPKQLLSLVVVVMLLYVSSGGDSGVGSKPKRPLRLLVVVILLLLVVWEKNDCWDCAHSLSASRRHSALCILLCDTTYDNNNIYTYDNNYTPSSSGHVEANSTYLCEFITLTWDGLPAEQL